MNLRDSEKATRTLAVVGIGNTLAGDDGLGVEAIRRLRPRWDDNESLLLEVLEGDLLAVADLLPRAGRIVFVDALAGDIPGEVVVGARTQRAFAPSFHQADIGAVMASLSEIGVVDRFPVWEVWGVVVAPPRELGEGLSVEAERGLERLLERLECYMRTVVAQTGHSGDGFATSGRSATVGRRSRTQPRQDGGG